MPRPTPTTPILLAILATGAVGCFSARADSATDLPDARAAVPLTAMMGRDSVLFAGGCFWGVEAVFERVNGVLDVVSGYAGGDTPRPSYGMVSSGQTGHAEVVKVVFDPSKVSYTQLLKVFFQVAHDPTQLNRQGPDRGTQYRSAIYTASDAQLTATRAYVGQLTSAKVFGDPIVTEITGWQRFHVAEDYHQGYYDQHPNQIYIVVNDKPKVAALEREFPELYRAR